MNEAASLPLPAEFKALEPFTTSWVLADSRARAAARQGADYDAIKRFYDTILPMAPAILEYLDARSLGALDPADENLLKLMLSLAELGPAVEWYGSPQVVEGFPAERFPLVEQLADCESQT